MDVHYSVELPQVFVVGEDFRWILMLVTTLCLACVLKYLVS
jgi:hypothetical protein